MEQQIQPSGVVAVRTIKREWGVAMIGLGLLGGCWFDLPIEPWPKRFRTRQEARATARAMTAKFLYLRPSHVWAFRAVRLRITVDWS